jgi:pimeloyl-ACP methyl ester carboxylesterase
MVSGAVVLAAPAPGFDGSVTDYENERDKLLSRTADQWRAALPGAYAAFADFAVRTLPTALGPGSEGWREDDEALRNPWGFELEQIRVPVRLRHGRADTSVPIENGEALAARIPGVETEFTGDDHLAMLFRDPADDFRWLASV